MTEDERRIRVLEALAAHPLAGDVFERRRARIADVVVRRLSSITVVMENVADPHNASAVLRTAEGLGVGTIHVVEQGNKWEKNKAIAKSAERWVHVQKHDGLARCLGDLSAAGFQLYAADVGEGCVPVHDIPVDKPVALVFGSEHAGLSKRALSLTDARFTVPMYGFVESFNVSVSAALALYDVTHRRRVRLGRAGDLDDAALVALAHRYLEKSVRDPRRLQSVTPPADR